MHYYALVLIPAEGPAEAHVALLMAPYSEIAGDYPDRVREFVDSETEELPKWENDTSERIAMPDGRLLFPFDDEFRVVGTFGMSFGGPDGSSTHRPPPHLPRLDVPFRQLYPTFDQYMQECCGHDGRDEETGRYGYWQNKQALWDFWAIGGRYSGRLDGYDPEEDPRNHERCVLCTRTPGIRYDHNPSGAPCNGCNMSEDQKKLPPGICVKWPTQWAFHEGDVQPSPRSLTDDQVPYTLIGSDFYLVKERWIGGEWLANPEHAETVRRRVAEHHGRVVVVDYHS